MAMTKSKFNVGDRVVYTQLGHPIGGTVLRVEAVPHHSGIFSAIAYHLTVILDTAEEVTDTHGTFWFEHEYDPRIPF